MSKERLEKAKLMAEMLRVETRLPHDFPFDLVDWLVEQAEQKQSLETTVDFYQSAIRDADRRVQELENANRVINKANVGSERAKERLRKWIDELEIENEHYREVLAFYADEETYETKFATDTDETFDPFTLIELDEGKKARKALEGEE